MKLRGYTSDLILANLLFGVSYSVVVSLLEQEYSPNQIFIAQIIVGALIFTPYVRIKLLKAHLPHLLRNTIVLLFGWQHLTLLGSKETPPLTIAAISILGLGVTLLAARNIHNLRLATIPLMVLILALPYTTAASEWMILCGVVCVAISTILSRDMVRQLGTPMLLGGYFGLALLLSPILLPHPLSIPTSTSEILPLLYQTILGSALPLYLLLHGSAHSTPLKTALSRYLQSAITIIVLFVPNLSNLLIGIMISFVLIDIYHNRQNIFTRHSSTTTETH
ncbi:MAG: hypothetical protein SNF68_03265 [Rikenellaceae bacterium]